MSIIKIERTVVINSQLHNKHIIIEPYNLTFQLTSIEITSITMSDSARLTTLFNACLNILRSEHLTGDKALRSLSNILILKLLEPRIGTTIDFENYDYPLDGCTDGSDIVEYKAKLLNLLKFSNLAKAAVDNLPTTLWFLCDDILSEHPVTRNIFAKGVGFDIKLPSTFSGLIVELNKFDFTNISEDILGEAYEEIIKGYMTDKTLGQFFTPPVIKQLMVKMIDPRLKPDGTIETIFDPAMGTGGFLITAMRHIHLQATEQKIDIDWKFITTGGLGGKEAEPDTHKLAVSNMLISTGHISDNLLSGDSIRDPITGKYDIVFANPPFGVKGIDYNAIKHIIKNQYIPIKSTEAVPLFLQAIICMLKINGRCAVILPDGKELFGKSKELVAVRRYLMATCDLTEVVYLPSNTFSHTAIRTCILKFVKKVNAADVMEVGLQLTKNGKERSRTCSFRDIHSTTSVKFYNYTDKGVVLLTTVPMAMLISANYTLNYKVYMTTGNLTTGRRRIGDVCNIRRGTLIIKKNTAPGEYPVYGGGGITFTSDKFNREGFNIIVGKSGVSIRCVRFTTEKFYINSSGFTLHSNDETVITNIYLAYYLTEHQDIVYNCARGVAQLNLDIDMFNDIQIACPSIEEQNRLTNQADVLTNSNYQLRTQIEKNKADIRNIFRN